MSHLRFARVHVADTDSPATAVQATHDRQASIAAVRAVVDKYEPYPEEVQPALRALRTALMATVEKAQRECKKALAAEQLAPIDSCLAAYAESGAPPMYLSLAGVRERAACLPPHRAPPPPQPCAETVPV